MGISGTLGALSGLVGIGGGIAGLVGGSPAQNVQLPPPLPGVQQAGQQALGGIGSLGQYNLYGQNIPLAQQTSMGLYNNPYASAYQAAAVPAGSLAQQGALNQFGAGSNLYGGGMQALQTGMDPQQALYARTLQQVQDQANVNNAMAGVATTPYGAGLTNMATTNFNIDWQNQQLNRQLAALSGAGGAFGQAQGLQAGAPGLYMQGAGLPYSTFGQIGQGQLGALGGLGQYGQQAALIPQTQSELYSQYATQGQQLANQGAQLGLNQAQLAGQQTAGYGQAIGGGLGYLANQGWNNPYGGWGGGVNMSAYAPGGSAYGAVPSYVPGYGYRPMYG